MLLISLIDIYFNIMNIKSSKELVDQANETIKVLSPEQVKNAYDKKEVTLIDVRDIRELWKEGTIKDAIHIPRGLIEFKISNISSITDEDANILVYCAGGYRSALAAKTLKDFGFKNVFNIGGYEEWILNGGEIQAFV